MDVLLAVIKSLIGNVNNSRSDGSTMCDFHNFGLIFAGQYTVCLKG